MSRRQDLVLARMRLLAMRWRAGGALEWPQVASAGMGAQRDDGGVGRGGPGDWGDETVGGGPEGDTTSGGPEAVVSGWVPGADDLAGSGETSPNEVAGSPARGAQWGQRTPARLWVSVVTVVVIAAIVIAGVALLRAWPSPVEVASADGTSTRGFSADPETGAAGSAATPDVSDSAADAAGGGEAGAGTVGVGEASPAQSPSTDLTVHVAGPVRHPGLVVLPAGSRVADALAAAGGLRAGADLGETNLARLVSDGERIEIGAADPGTGSTGAEPGTATTAIVDLNTATLDQLDTLPGIGPVTAAKILAWREEHGRFSTVDELAEVSGIGPKTLEELRPYVRV